MLLERAADCRHLLRHRHDGRSLDNADQLTDAHPPQHKRADTARSQRRATSTDTLDTSRRSHDHCNRPQDAERRFTFWSTPTTRLERAAEPLIKITRTHGLHGRAHQHAALRRLTPEILRSRRSLHTRRSPRGADDCTPSSDDQERPASLKEWDGRVGVRDRERLAYNLILLCFTDTRTPVTYRPCIPRFTSNQFHVSRKNFLWHATCSTYVGKHEDET